MRGRNCVWQIFLFIYYYKFIDVYIHDNSALIIIITIYNMMCISRNYPYSIPPLQEDFWFETPPPPPPPPPHLSVNVWFQKISIPPPRMVLWFGPFPLPGISSLALYFLLKIWAIATSLPFGISTDHPWGKYGYFLEPHNSSLEMFAFENSCNTVVQTQINLL